VQIFEVPLNESSANAPLPGEGESASDDEPAGEEGVRKVSDYDLEGLIGHRTSVTARTPVEQVYESFRTHAYEFVAVLDENRFVGLCARREIGMLLGARYGFSLFARRPISAHLMAQCLVARVDTPLSEVFEMAFSRPEGTYYDDLVVVDERGNFLGLIFTRTLVRLQHEMLQRNIDALTEKQAEIRRKNEQMEEELRVAHELQEALLPAEFTAFPPGSSEEDCALAFSYCYRPAGTVGGDFFHLQSVSENVVGVFLCDVMGHGVSAALVTAMLRTLVEELQPDAGDPGALLAKINRELRTLLKRTGGVMFVTAASLVIDTSAGEARYCLAGHPAPILVNRAAGTAEPLRSPRGSMGPVLGLFDDARYATVTCAVEAGDRMVLFTDGVFEVDSSEGEEFGQKRILDLVRRTVDIPGKRLSDAVLSELREFSGSREFADDVCLVCMDVRRVGDGAPLPG